MSVKNLWNHAAASEERQFASIWMIPQEGIWSFTVAEVVERLNEWLGCLGADFRFEPDPRVSEDHYALMKMRDHTQALAVAALGRMVAQTLLDERSK
jgi:hypothetical protein